MRILGVKPVAWEKVEIDKRVFEDPTFVDGKAIVKLLGGKLPNFGKVLSRIKWKQYSLPTDSYRDLRHCVDNVGVKTKNADAVERHLQDCKNLLNEVFIAYRERMETGYPDVFNNEFNDLIDRLGATLSKYNKLCGQEYSSQPTIAVGESVVDDLKDGLNWPDEGDGLYFTFDHLNEFRAKMRTALDAWESRMEEIYFVPILYGGYIEDLQWLAQSAAKYQDAGRVERNPNLYYTYIKDFHRAAVAWRDLWRTYLDDEKGKQLEKDILDTFATYY